MQLDDLLRLLRTRWHVIVGVIATFVVLTWVLVPDRLPSAGRTSFQATATLVVLSGGGSSGSKAQGNQLATYTLVATQGQVPNAVAKQTGTSAADVLAKVQVTSSAPTNSLNVIATERTPEAAIRLADLFASELTLALSEETNTERATSRAALVSQIDVLTAEASRLAARAATDPPAKAALDATSKQLTTQRARLTELDGVAPSPPLRTLGPAAVRQIDQTAAAEKLLALPVRTFLAFMVGLGASIGVLLLADRFDVRLHSKESVEVAFGLPVLAEVPVLPRKLRRTMVVMEAPETAFAEAHRILRTSVEVARPEAGDERPDEDAPRLIVVTSADPGEGKTTTSINLAASFAEAGRATLLVGGDLRHCDLHEVVRGPLRAEIISIGTVPGARPIQVRVAPTRLHGLRLATVEQPLGRPSVVLPQLARWLRDLRDDVDVIVVDTPPLLVCNDASELIPAADSVIVVCRVGGTTADAAERCSEVLARLRARVIGAVMVGAALRAPVRKVYGYGLSGPLHTDAEPLGATGSALRKVVPTEEEPQNGARPPAAAVNGASRPESTQAASPEEPRPAARER